MLDVEVDKQSIRDLNWTLARIQKDLGKSATTAVFWAARKIATAGAKLSKPGKKLRPIRTTKFPGTKFWKVEMEVWSQKSSTPEWVTLGLARRQGLTLADPRKVQRRTIERHGLAQLVWRVIGAKIGSSRPGSGHGRKSRRSAYRNAKVIKKISPTEPTITLINRLSYWNKAYPGKLTEVIRKGTDALQHQVNLRLKGVIK